MSYYYIEKLLKRKEYSKKLYLKKDVGVHNMNKTADMFKTADLVKKISENLGITKKEAEEKVVGGWIQAVKDLISDESKDGLDIYGFEKYEVKTSESIKRRNPATGETFMAKPKTTIRPRLSKKIKELNF